MMCVCLSACMPLCVRVCVCVCMCVRFFIFTRTFATCFPFVTKHLYLHGEAKLHQCQISLCKDFLTLKSCDGLAALMPSRLMDRG